jgi:pimeloyl-ACP methyl ester carboxylesterase
VSVPETRYARSGDVHIAYQVTGDGPVDLVMVPPWITHLEQAWENKAVAAHFDRLGSFSRLIRFDKRGTGLSDRSVGIADMETRMDDARAVMDAADSDRAVILGLSEGAPLGALFAATYPDRTTGLILYGSFARVTRAPGYPWGPTREEALADLRGLVGRWGTREWAEEALRQMGVEPSDEEVDFWSRRWRASASPGEVEQLELMNLEIDVRDILPTIRVPTLVLHRTSDLLPVEGARYVAERIPTARFVEFPGREHGIVMGDPEPIEREIRAFVESLRDAAEPVGEPERVLATVLFTDIVGSTARAVELGARKWRELVAEHHARFGASWRDSAAASSTPPATGSSPRSTGPPAACAAPAP